MNAITPALTGTPIASTTDAERFQLEIHDGVPRLDSRVIAERFDKWHAYVLRSIDLLVQRRPALALRNFAEGFYTTPQTGPQRHRRFLVDRDGFLLLAMGFTGDAALAWKLDYLDAFNRMEATLRTRQSPALDLDDSQSLRRALLAKLDEVDALRARSEADRLARIEAEDVAVSASQDFLDTARALTIVTHRAEATAAELAQKAERVEVLQPKAVAYDILSAAKESKLISLYAKDLGIPQRRLFAMLDRWDWIYQRTSREMKGRKGPWVGGYRGLKHGYVEHDTDVVDTGVKIVESRQVMITAKGQRFIEAQLVQGKLPLNGPRKA